MAPAIAISSILNRASRMPWVGFVYPLHDCGDARGISQRRQGRILGWVGYRANADSIMAQLAYRFTFIDVLLDEDLLRLCRCPSQRSSRMMVRHRHPNWALFRERYCMKKNQFSRVPSHSFPAAIPSQHPRPFNSASAFCTGQRNQQMSDPQVRCSSKHQTPNHQLEALSSKFCRFQTPSPTP